MRHQTEEQEKILNLVKWGECREILDKLNKREVRGFRPSFVNRLLFELIPLQTRPARELTMFVIEYGRCDWDDPNDEGILLHKIIIRSGRAELAAKAAAGLRKKDAVNPKLASVWAELACWLLSKQQRSSVMDMLKKGVLKNMGEEELEEVLCKVLAYQDLELLDMTVRYTRNIPVKLIDTPENLSDYRFTRELLERYRKYIKIQDNTKRLWELSLLCGAGDMTKYLLKKTRDFQYLPRLAESSNDMFELLMHIRCRNILDEVKKEVFFGALRSDAWKERFELLAGKGWKKSGQNRKKDICLEEEYLKILEKKKYTPGRKGHLEQINDRARLRFVKGYEHAREIHH